MDKRSESESVCIRNKRMKSGHVVSGSITVETTEVQDLTAGSSASSKDPDSVKSRFNSTDQNNRGELGIYSSQNSSPLGLKLKKTESLVDLVKTKLSDTSNCRSTEPNQTSKLKQKRKIDDSNFETKVDIFKASNLPALLVKIGKWEKVSVNDNDIVAKFYYAKRKIVWELLGSDVKEKMEIQWDDICAIRAIFIKNEPGILEIQLINPPVFFEEMDPEPRKHIIWQPKTDFTGGMASVYRRHFVQFDEGSLERHYEKLLCCDKRLFKLSQEPFPTLSSPFFYKFHQGCIRLNAQILLELSRSNAMYHNNRCHPSSASSMFPYQQISRIKFPASKISISPTSVNEFSSNGKNDVRDIGIPSLFPSIKAQGMNACGQIPTFKNSLSSSAINFSRYGVNEQQKYTIFGQNHIPPNVRSCFAIPSTILDPEINVPIDDPWNAIVPSAGQMVEESTENSSEDIFDVLSDAFLISPERNPEKLSLPTVGEHSENARDGIFTQTHSSNPEINSGNLPFSIQGKSESCYENLSSKEIEDRITSDQLTSIIYDENETVKVVDPVSRSIESKSQENNTSSQNTNATGSKVPNDNEFCMKFNSENPLLDEDPFEGLEDLPIKSSLPMIDFDPFAEDVYIANAHSPPWKWF